MAEVVFFISDSEDDDNYSKPSSYKRTLDVIDITSDSDDSISSRTVFKHSKVVKNSEFSEDDFDKMSVCNTIIAKSSKNDRTTSARIYTDDERYQNDIILSNFSQSTSEIQLRSSTSNRNLIPLRHLPSNNDGKRLPDLRDWFIYTLLLHAQNLKPDSYTKQTYTIVIKSVFRIAIYPHPIRSIESCAKQVDHCGIKIKDILKSADDSSYNEATCCDFKVPPYKFLCAAAATLVCLLEHSSSSSSSESAWLSLDELLYRVNAKLYTPQAIRGKRLRNTLDLDTKLYVGDANHRSIAYDSISQLEVRKISPLILI